MAASNYGTLVVLSAFFCLASASAANDTHNESRESPLYSAPTLAIFTDYLAWRQSLQPVQASLKGFHQFDRLLPNTSLAANEAKAVFCADLEARVRAVLEGKDELGDVEAFYLKMVRREAAECVSGLKFRAYLLTDISVFEGVQSDLAEAFKTDNFFRLESASDFDNVLERLRAVEGYIDDIIATSREGIKAGITYAKESVSDNEAFLDVIEQTTNNTTGSAFFYPLRNLSLLSDADANRTRSDAVRIISTSIGPAFKRLHDFVQKEYIKNVRKGPGLSSLPDGLNFYKARLQYYTTMGNVTVEHVHQTGLDKVSQLLSELKQLIEKTNSSAAANVSVSDFIAAQEDKPENKFSSSHEILTTATSLIKDRIDPKLKKLFADVVLTEDVYKLEVKPIPKGKFGVAYYDSPSFDGKVAGVFYVSTDVSVLRRYEMAALSLHEANPGHNMQFAFLAGPAKGSVPEFIRLLPFSQFNNAPNGENGFNAYSEGWGLYAEQLGHELGVYESDSDRLGYYALALLRAVRLVVDTGIHALGWSRQKAIDYMVQNAPISKKSAELEIDRYITWPGQATAYFMGLDGIRRLRSKKESDLGRDFDLKQFHTDLLSCPGPIDMLEECFSLQENIRRKRAKTPKLL